MTRKIRLFCCLLFLLLPSTLLATAVYTVLEPPEGYDRIYIERVSADGGTIIGRLGPDDGGATQAFAWREATGYMLLREVVDDPGVYATTAVDLSADGTIIVGSIIRGEPGPTYDPTASIWTVPIDGSAPQVEEIVMESGGVDQEFTVQLISGDGSTVVGTYIDTLLPCPGDSNSGDVVTAGARYDRGDGTFEPFGQLPDNDCVRGRYFGQLNSTYVHGVTTDGGSVVGAAGGQIEVNSQEDIWSPIYEAFAYDGSMTGLDNITDPEDDSYARGVSSDGSIIFGVYVSRYSPSDFISRMVRWVGGSRQDLNYPDPILSGGAWDYGGGLGMCDNGDFIWYDTTVWSAAGGWESIEELAAPLGINFDGFLYQIRPKDMSADGNVIIGTGWTGSETGAWRIIKNACPDYQSGDNVSEWYLGGDGLLGDEQSWENNQPPGVLSYGWFDVTGTPFTVSLARSHSLGGIRHSAGDVTFALAGHTLSLGSPADCGPVLQSGEDDQIPVNLTFRDGRVTVNGDARFIGGDLSSCSFDDTALVQVIGSMYVDGPPTHVVGIGDNSYLEVAEQLVLGDRTDKRGEILLLGEQASLSTRALVIGNEGQGKCIADTGSLTTTDSLLIGHGIGGTGDLLVKGGATVQADWITMSLVGEAQSFVTLQDGGSELLCGTMIVGLSDSARVSVIDSAGLGVPDSSWIAAGFIADAAGDIVVSGTGSAIDAGTLDIAVGGLGDLQVLDGARVGSGSNPIDKMTVASDSGSAASILVSGNFARLFADTLILGLDGTAILQCDPSGYVQANAMFVGPLGNVIGNVLAISTLNPDLPKSASADDSGLAVASLVLQHGATVDVDSVYLGEGGTLAGSGEVALDLINDGTIAPGDSVGDLATFTVTGNYTQTADGELAIELGDSGASDRLAVSGAAALDGSLMLTLAPGYTPQMSDTFTIATAGSFSGDFAGMTPPPGTDVAYTVTADTITVRFLTVTDVRELDDPEGLPVVYRLEQNYPNPFNPTTEIEFSIPVAGQVRLEIYNMLGQRVKTLVDQHLSAGSKVVKWDGQDFSGRAVASGIYLYRLVTDGHSSSRKMMLIK